MTKIIIAILFYSLVCHPSALAQNLNIQHFKTEQIPPSDQLEIATETINLRFENSASPDYYVFIAASNAFMRINGRFEKMRNISNTNNGNRFKTVYANKQYKAVLNAVFTEDPNSAIEGRGIIKGTISVTHLQNKTTKTIHVRGEG
jgi:hypothetical protein